MAGELWVDPVQERVVRLAGSLQHDKDIALGIVQLDKGGWVEIEQADVGGHQWRIVHLKLVMNARVLFKQKNSDSVQDYSQFAPLPQNLSYRQAIELLRAIPAGGKAGQ
jgi:acetate kinase